MWPSRLERCRGLVGGSTIHDPVPAVRVLEDVTYWPHSRERSWGLVQDGRQVAEQAGDAPPEPPDIAEPPPLVPGTFIYFGLIYGHFGHFICDVFSWAWPILAQAGPGVRLLCHSDGPREAWTGLDHVRTIFREAGFAIEDVVSFDRPVRLERVIAGGPSFWIGHHAHRVFRELCGRTGAGLWDGVAVDSVARPAYLSKSRLPAGMTRMVNEGDLERELARNGVDVVHPQELSFRDQVRLFAERRLILGTAGSGLHACIFGPSRRRILALNYWRELHGYYALVDRLTDNDARYYHPVGTELLKVERFGFGWRVPNPRAVARELLERAAQGDALDARDAAEEAARASLPGRAVTAAYAARARARRFLRGLAAGR